jgi:hypothetical protein
LSFFCGKISHYPLGGEDARACLWHHRDRSEVGYPTVHLAQWARGRSTVNKTKSQEQGAGSMSWLSRLLGTGSDTDKAGAALDGALKKALEGLDKKHPGLSQRAYDYVTQGEPVGVLAEVTQDDHSGTALGTLNGWHQRGDTSRTALYESIASLPAAATLRWAKLLVASAQAGRHGRSNMFDFASQAEWPQALLLNASGLDYNTYGGNPKPHQGLTMQAFEAALVEDGMAPAALVAAAFGTDVNQGYGRETRLEMVASLNGYAQALQAHVEAVKPLLGSTNVRQRLHMLNMLAKATPETLVTLAAPLCQMAVASSKQVRAAAEPLVRKIAQGAYAELRGIAVKEKPEQRYFALRLIHDLGRAENDAAMQEFARSTAAADKAPNVNALPAEWDGQASAGAAYVLPEYTVPKIDWDNAFTPEVEAAVDRLFAGWNELIDKANAASRARVEAAQAAGQKGWHHHEIDRYIEKEVAEVKRHLRSPEPKTDHRIQFRRAHAVDARPLFTAFIATPGLGPVAMIKLLDVLGMIERQPRYSRDLGGLFAMYMNEYKQLHPEFGLLELALIVECIGLEPDRVIASYCSNYGSLAGNWEDETVWPYFLHYLEDLLRAMGAANNYYFDRARLYKAIGTLPVPPEAVVNQLFDLALGTGKTERPLAQDALAKMPNKEARIIAALGDGKSDARANAANWLARLQHKAAVPALEQALAKEKHDIAKGAILGALEVLGQPMDQYLRRDLLEGEAKKAIAKGVPKDLEWFPRDTLPPVAWEDGSAVSPDILTWFLIQAVKQKSPEPNAMLRQYCARFEAKSREAFGQFVLDAWLKEDVRPIPAEEAMQRARSSAQSTFNYMKSHPQYYQDSPNLGKSVEELVAAYLPGLLRTPAGSAAASKGLLAIASACAGARAAGSVGRYLKEYYGTRAAQGKALIAMLAWVEHPSATQLMLSIGNRFRTKSFQEEATRQAELLAERKGWTLAELADRTIPAAGFDESGSMELNYGSRVFTARLLDDFKIELANPEGKKIANLPEPRQDDDEALAKECKKALSTAKKEIKTIVQLQTDRLYEALCTGRDWSYEDWSLYLAQHAVMRRLIQRLVWVRMEEDAVAQVFRPLADGSLTDVEDNEVTLPPEARVRLAHDSVLGAEAVAAWQQHLADYEISPLFQQLGKGVYALPPDKAQATEIKDFEGHLLEAYSLRGRALKLGYTRGPAEDGGWFHVYEKRFPTLGITAVIQFTGNPLPETNRTVALLTLSFEGPQQEGQWQRPGIKLLDVPKVLLSECYNDMRLIAADGSGYDAQWQKKSEY